MALVDPTATGSGAAVLRLDGEVAAWWAWTLLSGGWRVRQDRVPVGAFEFEEVGGYVTLAEATGDVGRDSLTALDRARRPRGDLSLVVEGLFVAPRWARRSSGSDVVALAEATGATIAGFRRAGLPEPSRPTAKQWRAPFGLARLNARAAEDAAVALARREGWLPRGLTVAEQGAVSEAGLIAQWRPL